MVRKLIKVTEEDIKNGYPANCSKCPIALAVNRTLAVRVDIGEHYCHFMYGSSSLPRSAKRFVKSFDKGKSVKPFNFYLRLPS